MTKPIQLGKVLSVKQRDGGFNPFVVTGYNEADYMLLTHQTNRSVTMTIHPEHAKRIAEKADGDSGIKVLNCNDLNDIIVKTTETVVDVPTTVETPVSTGSKKERALAIKAANPNATRKELIAMFVEQLGMTPAGASTYASIKG